jgi:2-dehydro-3-deoxygluconokinase
MDEVYFAILQQGPEMAISRMFPLTNITDKVGSGDCFMAGLIYGLRNHHTPIDIINYAAAAAVGKMQEKGDATNQSIESVKKIIR